MISTRLQGQVVELSNGFIERYKIKFICLKYNQLFMLKVVEFLGIKYVYVKCDCHGLFRSDIILHKRVLLNKLRYISMLEYGNIKEEYINKNVSFINILTIFSFIHNWNIEIKKYSHNGVVMLSKMSDGGNGGNIQLINISTEVW